MQVAARWNDHDRLAAMEDAGAELLPTAARLIVSVLHAAPRDELLAQAHDVDAAMAKYEEASHVAVPQP